MNLTCNHVRNILFYIHNSNHLYCSRNLQTVSMNAWDKISCNSLWYTIRQAFSLMLLSGFIHLPSIQVRTVFTTADKKGNCVPDFHTNPSLWLQLRMWQLFHSIKPHRTTLSSRTSLSILFYQLKEKKNESHWKRRWKRSIRSSAPSLCQSVIAPYCSLEHVFSSLI